jgi:hypothetical protein
MLCRYANRPDGEGPLRRKTLLPNLSTEHGVKPNAARTRERRPPSRTFSPATLSERLRQKQASSNAVTSIKSCASAIATASEISMTVPTKLRQESLGRKRSTRRRFRNGFATYSAVLRKFALTVEWPSSVISKNMECTRIDAPRAGAMSGGAARGRAGPRRGGKRPRFLRRKGRCFGKYRYSLRWSR